VDPDAEPKNGIVQEPDGKLYYYVNGKLTYGGLMYIDGYYYYATSAGEIITSRNYWISKTNNLLPEKKYEFGADGKMLNPPAIGPVEPDAEPKNGIVQEADGKLYYYVNGKLTYAGLIKIDGYYYYVTSAGEVITDRNYWITKTNGLMAEKKYQFGADGKMLNPPVEE
jgi:glucan-binding YG repeat protein